MILRVIRRGAQAMNGREAAVTPLGKDGSCGIGWDESAGVFHSSQVCQPTHVSQPLGGSTADEETVSHLMVKTVCIGLFLVSRNVTHQWTDASSGVSDIFTENVLPIGFRESSPPQNCHLIVHYY